MTIRKEARSLGMPWENEYGYSQAVKVGDIIYLATTRKEEKLCRLHSHQPDALLASTF